jgi:hypothetical protein
METDDLVGGQQHAGDKWTDVLGWSKGEVTIGEGTLFLASKMGSGKHS